MFNGDKSNYESWKSAFTACIDKAPATQEYRFLQQRQCLSGEALRTIQNLGHSAASYEAAKTRLERKFGDQRRKIALYLEQLERGRCRKNNFSAPQDKTKTLRLWTWK